MSRSRKIWTGGLLSLSLTVGCQHAGQPVQECSTCSAIEAQPAPGGPSPQRLSLVPVPSQLAPATPPTLVPTTPSLVAPTTPSLVPITPYHISVSQSPAPRTLPPVTPTPTPLPAVNPEQSAPPASPWTLPNPDSIRPVPDALPVPIPAPTVTEPRQSSLAPASTPAADSLPTTVVNSPVRAPAPTAVTAPARAWAPTTAATNPAGPAPQYFNSPDYSILFGVLDYNARRGTWRLRYADAGDEDRYGGSVTLDGIGRQMDGFTGGQVVRVEGSLVDSESRDASPAYKVREMRPATAAK